MNHRSAYDEAYIQYKVTVDTDPSLTPVEPYWLDVRNCSADPIYNVPGTKGRGSTQVRSWDYRVPEAGRVVAGGGHVHGGARRLTLTEPDCEDREIARSVPTWGLPDHPFYNVRPVLHEPGPINMSGFGTPTGIPVAEGERLRLSSLYEDSQPHVRVMGIMVIFVASDPEVTERCGPLPDDVTTVKTDSPVAGAPSSPTRSRSPDSTTAARRSRSRHRPAGSSASSRARRSTSGTASSRARTSGWTAARG